MRAPLILPSDSSGTPGTDDAPRRDFDLLSDALGGAPLLFPPRRGGVLTRAEKRTACDLRQAFAALRAARDVSVYISLSERVGLPLAVLLRRLRNPPPHVLVAHHLTSARKRALQRRMRWLEGLDRIVVSCIPQEQYLRETLGAYARIWRLPVGIDTCFWQAPAGIVPGPGLVVAVGRERRDYPTLLAAARMLPALRFVLVTGSPWSRQTRRTPGGNASPNVTITPGGLLPTELRALVARASVVALPLEGGCLYAAGVNALLEARALGRPVVATCTPGLAEYIDGHAGTHTVPPGDPAALAAALANQVSALSAPTNEPVHRLEDYVAALAGVVREVAAV